MWMSAVLLVKLDRNVWPASRCHCFFCLKVNLDCLMSNRGDRLFRVLLLGGQSLLQ